MRRSVKSALGVTLLEIMLVLAIAAMVVVMSIRYYQSATTNQKVSSTINGIIAVMAAGENYLSSNGSFTGMADANITPYMPGNKMPVTGWAGVMSVSAGAQGDTYTIAIPNVPAGVCPQLDAYLKQGGKASLDSTTACTKVQVTTK